MKKNTASQVIGAQMISATDGSDFTGTVTVSVTIDGGTKTAGVGIVTNKTGGSYSYAPTQAETNGSNIVFTFSGTGAISSAIQVYTTFPQTSDNATALVTIDGNVGQLLLDVADVPTVSEFNARTLLSTDYFNPSTDVVANVTNVATSTNLTNLPAITTNWLTSAGIQDGALTSAKGTWNVGKTGYSISGTITTLDGLENIAITDIVSGGAITTLAGIAEANAVEISGDAVAANNLESQFDGTGYVDDTAPATQAGLGNLSTGSAAISTSASSSNLVSGTEVNLYTDTETVNGVEHEISDTAGTTEVIYEFNVGGSGVAAEASFTGRLNSNNDSIQVYARDWTGPGTTWSQIGEVTGINGAINLSASYNLLVKHTGTAADLGKVQIRFQSALLSTSTLYIDQLITNYAVVSKSVGYADGSIWIDTVNGTSGTEPFVNGTADNPVNSKTDAMTLATSVGLSRFFVVNGSSITFGESHDDESWVGQGWSLSLGASSISGAYISGAVVSGIATGAVKPHFEHCEMGTVTLPPCRVNGSSGFTGSFTAGSAGDFDIIDCNSLFAGAASPTIDLGLGIGPSDFHIRGWGGGLTFSNIEAGDMVSLEGVGGVVSVNGTGGEVHIRGIFEDVVDNSSAAVNVVQTASISRGSLAGYESSSVYINSASGNTGEVDYVDGTADNPVSTISAATAIATSLGLTTFSGSRGTSYTIAQDYAGVAFVGGSINMGGRDLTGCTLSSALITGVAIGAALIVFDRCKITNVTAPPSVITESSLSGTLILGAAGNYNINNCNDSEDIGSATIDFGAIGNNVVQIHKWSGDLELLNMGQLGTDSVTITGQSSSLVVNANCVGGTLTVAGDINVIDNSGGAVTVVHSSDPSLTTDILADTNVLQTEWANGGRLDNILDNRMPTTHISATAGSVDNVTLVDTTTDYTNFIAPDNAGITANGVAIAALNDISVVDVLTTQMTEAYAVDGTAPTLTEALMLIQQVLSDFSITGVTNTVRKLDGVTTAATLTLTPDGTNPTGTTRAS